MKYILLAIVPIVLGGCVVVQPSNPPSATPTKSIEHKLPTPPTRPSQPAEVPHVPLSAQLRASAKEVKPVTFSSKWLCVSVSLTMATKELRDESGMPTGTWEPEKRYVVTLQPVTDGTNGPVVWGANRDGSVKIVTTRGEFQQGTTYVFESSVD